MSEAKNLISSKTPFVAKAVPPGLRRAHQGAIDLLHTRDVYFSNARPFSHQSAASLAQLRVLG
jgi:hypothetical protein